MIIISYPDGEKIVMRITTFTWLLLTLVLSSCKTVQPLSTTDQKTFLYHYKVDLGALEGDKLRIELDIEGLVPESAGPDAGRIIAILSRLA